MDYHRGMHTTSPRRYGAYHRVSDAAGRELNDESTITHREAFDQIDAWAKMRGATIVERYLDWDHTGSRMERPELDRMLADLDAGVIDAVIVAQVDRLSRAEVGDALATVKQIAGEDKDNPRPLVLLDLGIDPSTEFGEFGLTILLALSRMQWRRYKRQREAAQRRATARGAWIGSAPLGYRSTVIGVDARGNPVHGPLELDGERARIMGEAFRIAAAAPENRGAHAADAYLHVELGRRRHVTDTRRLLENRAYLGEHHADGPAHEPITTPALFEAAQSSSRGVRASGDYPLSHVATCAHCGAGLVGALQTVRERTYRRMRCSATCTGGVGSVSADALEKIVRDALRPALADKAFRLAYDAGDVEGAQATLEAAEAERIRFAKDAGAHAALGDEAWQAGAQARGDAVKQAREELGAAAALSARSESLPGPDELDDPVHFQRALAVVGRVVVAGGRRPIDERIVDFAWVGVDDLDDGVGVLAA